MGKIYRIGEGFKMKDGKLVKNNAATEYDLSDKSKSYGRFPPLWRGEAGLHHVERMLHLSQEEGAHIEEVLVDPHQEESLGGGQPQVYRHHLQVWSWKIPDPPREGCFHGSSQEGQERLEFLSFQTICIASFTSLQK